MLKLDKCCFQFRVVLKVENKRRKKKKQLWDLDTIIETKFDINSQGSKLETQRKVGLSTDCYLKFPLHIKQIHHCLNNGLVDELCFKKNSPGLVRLKSYPRLSSVGVLGT